MFMIYEYANYLDAPELFNISSGRICGNRIMVGIADSIEEVVNQIRSKALFVSNSLLTLYNTLSEDDIKYSETLQYVIDDLNDLYPDWKNNNIQYGVKIIIKKPINRDNDKTIIIAKAPAYSVLFEIVQFKNYKDLMDKSSW